MWAALRHIAIPGEDVSRSKYKIMITNDYVYQNEMSRVGHRKSKHLHPYVARVIARINQDRPADKSDLIEVLELSADLTTEFAEAIVDILENLGVISRQDYHYRLSKYRRMRTDVIP